MVQAQLLQGKMVVVTLLGGRVLRGRLREVTPKLLTLTQTGRTPVELARISVRRVRRFTQAETDAWLLGSQKTSKGYFVPRATRSSGIGAGGALLIVLGVVALVGTVALVVLAASWPKGGFNVMGDEGMYGRVLQRSR